MVRPRLLPILLPAALVGCLRNEAVPDDSSTGPGSSSDTTVDPTETTTSICGNGVPEDGEVCDDGNADATDDCTNSCASATCGDGYVRAGAETCDDGDDNSADAWSVADSSPYSCPPRWSAVSETRPSPTTAPLAPARAVM